MGDDNHFFRIRRVDWDAACDQIMAVRIPVFIEEQAVPESEERDGLDPQCWILLAEDNNGNPVGTARLLPSGQVGRMAVLKAWRQRGVGSALMQEIIAIARENRLPSLFLHGQVQAIPFYARHGFSAEGPVFEEAGIEHRIMRLKLVY